MRPDATVQGRVIRSQSHSEESRKGVGSHAEIFSEIFCFSCEASKIFHDFNGNFGLASCFVQEEFESSWRRTWAEGLGRTEWRGFRRGRELDIGEIDARCTVDHAVMNLCDHRELLAALESFDDPGFPEWSLAIERLCHHTGDESLQLQE